MKTLLLALLLCVPAFAQYNQNNFGGSTSSGNGVGAGASPVMAFYLSANCPASNTGNCFQTPANTQITFNCTTSTSNANVVCASGTFTQADVGKKLFGSGSCNPFQGAVTLGWSTPQTISSVTGTTTATVGSNAAQNTSGACIIWGTPDDAAATALDTYIQSAANTGWTCPRVELAASSYMWTAPHFYTQPQGCLATPGVQNHPAPAQGNLILEAGFELEGRGPGATIIYMPPDFPESDFCNHGEANVSCFAVPLMARFSNFQLSGAANTAGTNMPNGSSLINVDVGSLEYFTCTNIANFTAGNSHTGVLVTHWAQLQQVNVSNCGDIGVNIDGTSQASAFRLFSENSFPLTASSANLRSAGSFTCFYCDFLGNGGGNANNAVGVIQVGTSLLTLYSPNFNIFGGTNATAYKCTIATCEVTMYGGWDTNIHSNATNFTGINCTALCIPLLNNITISASGTGNPVVLSAGSYLISGGTNAYLGGAGVNLNGGTILNRDTQGYTAITAAKAVLSAGWGSTAAWSSLNGGNSFTGTITNSGTGQAANPTITYTFPSPLPVTPVACTAQQVGGTQANGTFTTSSVSITGCTFTYSGTPVASSTEIVNIFVQ